jgi:hypothetical protein
MIIVIAELIKHLEVNGHDPFNSTIVLFLHLSAENE